jgi:hypothetical protein
MNWNETSHRKIWSNLFIEDIEVVGFEEISCKWQTHFPSCLDVSISQTENERSCPYEFLPSFNNLSENHEVCALCPASGILNNEKTQGLGTWICFRLQARGTDTYSVGPPLDQKLSLALSKGPNRLGVSLPSPEDGNRSSFLIVFPVRTTDVRQNPQLFRL